MCCFNRKKISLPHLGIKMFDNMEGNQLVMRETIVEVQLRNGKLVEHKLPASTYKLGVWYTASRPYIPSSQPTYYGYHAWKPEHGKDIGFLSGKVVAVVELRGQLLEGTYFENPADYNQLPWIPKVLVGKRMQILAAKVLPSGSYDSMDLLSELLDIWAATQPTDQPTN